MSTSSCPWLLLIHQIPPTPAYLRVKVGRRLQALGAVAIKNSVYVLPNLDQSLEDFQWLRREIVAGGGDATVCEARWVEGRTDASVEDLFVEARHADYAALRAELAALERALPDASGGAAPPGLDDARARLARLKKQLAAIRAIDFFSAPLGTAVGALIEGVEARLRLPAPHPPRRAVTSKEEWMERVWVTRAGVKVDRIASAWLIRRFVDPGARFRFVDGHDYEPAAGDVRFDMFEAEFTHEGELCTFEVLARRFAPEDAALRQVGEIVHDVDLKDARFDRPEAAGLERLIAGLTARERDDEARIGRGAVLFDSLYESFRGSA
jgi:hypothetical protein